VSPLRLRFGVVLVILWLIPFWALGPEVAHALSGLSNPPSVAAVTTAIVAVQTILGLLGLWVAGTEVKSIVKGSSMRHALRALWSVLIHGEIPSRDSIGTDPSEGQPPAGSA
jgi:succinate dehydrogenase/fumarate reductase cytochrome b subunit